MKKREKEKRRSFLKHMLASTAVVAGAATITKPAKAKSTTKANQLDETLYHESESFKKYYKTLRS
jgi:hypothetical protein